MPMPIFNKFTFSIGGKMYYTHTRSAAALLRMLKLAKAWQLLPLALLTAGVLFTEPGGKILTPAKTAPRSAAALFAATLYVDNTADYAITNDVAPAGFSTGDTVTWNPGPGSAHGGSVAGLIVGTNAFDTIQGAVNAAAPGDTIRVAPGTFNEQ